MNMNFDFTGVEEAKSSFVNRLDCGVHSVTITGVKFDVHKSNDGTEKPYADITFANEDGQHVERFFFTVNALPRVQHLVKNATGKELAGSVNAVQFEKGMVGKQLDIKIVGKEYMKDGESTIRVRRELGFSGFAAPFQSNKLTYDKNRKSDYKPMEASFSVTSTDPAKTSTPDDLPF